MNPYRIYSPKTETTYYTAWNDWRKTEQFARLLESTTKHPGDVVYAENRLRQAFDAGWNAHEEKI